MESTQKIAILGMLVTASAICALAVRFSTEHKTREQALYEQALAGRQAAAA